MRENRVMQLRVLLCAQNHQIRGNRWREGEKTKTEREEETSFTFRVLAETGWQQQEQTEDARRHHARPFDPAAWRRPRQARSDHLHHRASASIQLQREERRDAWTTGQTPSGFHPSNFPTAVGRHFLFRLRLWESFAVWAHVNVFTRWQLPPGEAEAAATEFWCSWSAWHFLLFPLWLKTRLPYRERTPLHPRGETRVHLNLGWRSIFMLRPRSTAATWPI